MKASQLLQHLTQKRWIKLVSPGIASAARALAWAALAGAMAGCSSAVERDPTATLPPPLKPQAAPAGSNDWLMNAGYGVMVHWTSQSRPQSGAGPSAYCAAVNNFDVNLFAQQLQNAGAGYVIFTISHAQQYFAFPSPKLDSVLPGRTCTRDLYADLFNAIHPKGIRMVFYYPSVGTDEDPAWRDASKFNTDPAYFAQLQYDLVEEIGNRYGTRLEGWWVDNCYDSPPVYSQFGAGRGARYNFQTYAQKLRSGNPNRLVTFNFSYNQWNSSLGNGIVDYAAGEEDAIGRTPTSRFSGEGNAQWHTLVWMDDFWVHKDPGTPAPRYSNAAVTDNIAAIMDRQGAFSYNAAPFQDTLISNATMSQLQSVNATIHAQKLDDRSAALTYSSGWAGTSGANYANSTGTYSLNAGSSVQYTFNGTGVKWYGVAANDHGKADVYIDNALDATVDLYAPYWSANTVVYAKRGLSNGAHTLKIVVRADKNSGSSNRFVEVDALEALVPATPKIDDRNSAVTYSGSWAQISSGSYYNNTSTFTTTPGTAAELRFNGPGIAWIGPKGNDHGQADVFIDGAFQTTVDLYNTSRLDQAVLFTANNLASGDHVIRIVARNQKNAASSNYYVEVDAFQSGSSAQTQVDDRAAGISYAGSWAQITGAAYINSTGTFSTSSGSSAEFSFNGSSIAWIGPKGNDHGKADVYLDGTLQATVDLYDTARLDQALLFSQSGLSAGNHTLRIVVRSDKNAASSNVYVEVDAFRYN